MSFLSVWLVSQALSVVLVWAFTVGLGRKPNLSAAPRVAVIVAVKGHDYEFDGFLARLFAQKYPAFRVIFAVEAADDPAVPAIETYRAQAPDRIGMVVAGLSVDEGQKITNLRAALRALAPSDEILVFADADIWPDPDWLQRLIEPLARSEADVVSGFTWLVMHDRRLSTFMLTSMAASIVTIPRWSFLNAAWGGSTAIRHDRFDELNMANRWRGTLSDDLHLTNVMQQAGYDIAAPREILPRTPIVTNGFADVAAQTRRWYLLVRIYMPLVYGLVVAAMSFVALGWILALAATVTGDAKGISALLLGLLLSILRSGGRAMIVWRLWGRPGIAENRDFLLADAFVAPFAVVANAAFGWSALLMKRTTWAGIRYEITGQHSVKVLGRAAGGGMTVTKS